MGFDAGLISIIILFALIIGPNTDKPRFTIEGDAAPHHYTASTKQSFLVASVKKEIIDLLKSVSLWVIHIKF